MSATCSAKFGSNHASRCWIEMREEHMQSTIRKVMREAQAWAWLLALAMTAGAVGMSAARTDETNAKSAVKKMSDYMGAQKAISFDYDTNFEVVSKEGQKLGLASSGSMKLNRPDKIRATRAGGFANVEYVFDGNTLAMLAKNANAYSQVEWKGTLDQLVDELRNKFHRPIPGADLLMSNIYDQLMPEVVDSKDLGSGVVNGVECDHLAFRTKDVDWEIWIAQGSHPYPCRYVVTSTKVTGAPQYTVDIRAWKTGAQVAPDRFTLKVPAGARKLNPGELRDFDELPAIFTLTRQSGVN
jgi:hypothetical protein